MESHYNEFRRISRAGDRDLVPPTLYREIDCAAETFHANTSIVLGETMAEYNGHNQWKSSYQAPKIYLSRIEDISYVGKWGIVLDAKQEAPFSLSGLPSEVIGPAIQKSSVTKSESDVVYILANPRFKNYFHWMVQCVSGLYLLKEFPEGSTCKIVVPALADWQYRTIELAGVSLDRLEIVGRQEVRKFKSAIWPSLQADEAVVRPWPGLRPFYSAMRDKVVGTTKQDTLIYVSRRDTSRRPMTNETELESRIAELGFSVVVPGAMTVDEQIRTFSEAKVIVGSHGAGLTNIVYSRPGAAVYELFSKINPCFQRLALFSGHTYLADRFGITAAQEKPKNEMAWAVDVPYVVSRVEKLIKSIDRPGLDEESHV